MIRRNGALPTGSPEFSPYIDSDLLNYGYALLTDGLDLLQSAEETRNGESENQLRVARQAFIQSSYALEAATRNASESSDSVFHRLIAGAASHLGGYSARAFSLMKGSQETGQLSPMEATLADLAMRDLDAIEERSRLMRTSPGVADGALLASLSDDDQRQTSGLGPVALLLSESYLSAVCEGLYALEVADRQLLDSALASLDLGERAAMDVGAPSPWWVYRLTRKILEDLFESSINENIPVEPPTGSEADATRWRYLRRTFVEALLARKRSEIDLWPSQLRVVSRIFTDSRDLVVALPTSAGKTRIAELAILACLAGGRRIVYVTPLRALSAQTEQALTKTFSPLGVRVSSLYGSAGISDVDEDTLRSSAIVVATPEKLDFALRSDPTVLDDIGLVVLDEGHMIGASEREVRYEAQIQRLLRRSDASTRRIICLSAVFPSGQDLEDFVAWLTDDDPQGLHQEAWRPTLQRFGVVEWRTDHARLTITLGPDQPFIPRYFEASRPSGRRKNAFPTSQRELVIATAWRLVEESQTVLIFCPQRNSVEPYAREIIKLHKQGLITPVLPSGVDISAAMAVGAEWFGADHPILKCLEMGVAIHHGALPGPFRREVEKLLHEGILRVIVASPTLAQGLNLSASVVLFHSLKRGREMLKGSDFSNVIGRAGRAFVDTEGLVLYPIFEQGSQQREQLRQDWLRLTEGEGGKALNSGLIQVGLGLLRRLYTSRGSGPIEPFLDYLTGGPDWTLPVLQQERPEDQLTAAEKWRSNLALLDIGILSMIGDSAYDVNADAATQVLSDVLVNSLWERQLRHVESSAARAVRELVMGRVRHLWQTSTPSQRRGWYLAGLGAEAGTNLSAVSGQVIELIAQVEYALAIDDHAAAAEGLVEIAATVFGLDTFAPEVSLDNWEDVLRQWVRGLSLAELSGDRVAMARFVESDLVYRLVWGMEAARVYEEAQGNLVADIVTGAAVTAVETGTFAWSASLLIRSGFDHRLAAINAVSTTDADFGDVSGMRQWIDDLDPEYAWNDVWPSKEARSAWLSFASHVRRPQLKQWVRAGTETVTTTWLGDPPPPNSWLRITVRDADTIDIWSPGFELLGEANVHINRERLGILRAQRHPDSTAIRLLYRGPGDLHA
ncbi:DEAD/DEAH box helicase [Paenarthrobacter sp. NPDC090520]|uniref:DEAD/DEAH box helicase n=1 Tax=Paenarthrobacter sp. NPDC090520 TaxID=3364382 RepID=UPI0037F9BA86